MLGEETRRRENIKKVQTVKYTLLTKTLVVLMLLGRIAGFYVTLPGDLDLESIPDGRLSTHIVNVIFANISRFATFVVAYFVFTGSRKAATAAWIMFVFTLIHCITYAFPKLGFVFYNFDYTHLRLYVTLFFSLVLLALVHRDGKG